jgi:anti-anti-sigma factor
VATLGRTAGPDGAYQDLTRHHDAEPADGFVILRIESSLFFANADNVRARILDAGLREGVHAVILDAETSPFVDVTAARMLVDAHAELEAHGVRLVLARAVGQVRDVIACITHDDDLTAPYAKIDTAIAAIAGTPPR